MKFKISVLFCYLANISIFRPLVCWYLRKQGFEV